jgi:uncharacterized peroxidase-related enzyme
MAWIETIAPEHAQGQLRDIYSAIAGARAGVAEVHRAQSLNPLALKAHLEIYKAIVFQRSSLDRLARERIAVVVSAANRCAYCVAHHAEAARQLGDDPSVIEGLGRGELPDALPPAERAMLEWAKRAAVEPWTSDQPALHALRGHGFDERALLDATLTVAYFSFVNRIVLLLGVGLEKDYAKTCGSDGDASSRAGG